MTGPGLLDTSVVIDWKDPAVRAALPDELARLQEVEAKFEPIPFDAAAARSHGLVAAAALGKGPHPRTSFADLLIAASAHTHQLDLYTRNTADFDGPEELVRVIGV